MKIWVNQKIKKLWISILVIDGLFILGSFLCIVTGFKSCGMAVCIGAFLLMALTLLLLYRYFEEQNSIMEEAIGQIKAYRAGNQNARIESDEEGQLYRLFHEVNALVTRLNAQVENEAYAKLFLKESLLDISHQLKTPLAALNIYNGIIQDEAEHLQTIKEFADLSDQELDRIANLVQNLLKITKFEADAILFEKKLENVSEIMDSIEQHFSFRVKQEQKILKLLGDENLNLVCDGSWVFEAIANIVKNALDHTRSGDSICIEWKALTTLIQIIITDNGQGIHPEDLHHIFKRFYRSRFSKDTQGIGLGLPIAKAIVEAHGGTIEVISELEIGTTFTINFLIPTNL